jgi:hypothetical protein
MEFHMIVDNYRGKGGRQSAPEGCGVQCGCNDNISIKTWIK